MARPIYQTARGTSDANGNLTLTLPPPPVGYQWQVSVGVPTSPAWAVWTISAGPVPWGQTIGQALAPVQVYQSTQVTLTAASLPANTFYTAIAVGVEDTIAGSGPAAGPSTTQISGTVQAVATENTILLQQKQNAGLATLYTVNIAPNTRRLSLYYENAAGVTYTITGNQSSYQYAQFTPATPSGVLWTYVEPLMDTTVNLLVGGAAGSNFWLVASFANPLVHLDSNAINQGTGSGLTVVPWQVTNPGGVTKSIFSLNPVPANQNGVVAIAAPPVGQTIIVQSIESAIFGQAAADSFVNVFGAAGAILSIGALLHPTTDLIKTFPGGLQVGDNTAVTYSSGAQPTILAITYRTGPTQP